MTEVLSLVLSALISFFTLIAFLSPLLNLALGILYLLVRNSLGYVCNFVLFLVHLGIFATSGRVVWIVLINIENNDANELIDAASLSLRGMTAVALVVLLLLLKRLWVTPGAKVWLALSCALLMPSTVLTLTFSWLLLQSPSL